MIQRTRVDIFLSVDGDPLFEHIHDLRRLLIVRSGIGFEQLDQLTLDRLIGGHHIAYLVDRLLGHFAVLDVDFIEQNRNSAVGIRNRFNGRQDILVRFVLICVFFCRHRFRRHFIEQGVIKANIRQNAADRSGIARKGIHRFDRVIHTIKRLLVRFKMVFQQQIDVCIFSDYFLIAADAIIEGTQLEI